MKDKITYDGVEFVKGSGVLIVEHHSLLKRLYIKVRKIFNKNYGANGVWVVTQMGDEVSPWIMNYRRNDD